MSEMIGLDSRLDEAVHEAMAGMAFADANRVTEAEVGDLATEALWAQLEMNSSAPGSLYLVMNLELATEIARTTAGLDDPDVESCLHSLGELVNKIGGAWARRLPLKDDPIDFGMPETGTGPWADGRSFGFAVYKTDNQSQFIVAFAAPRSQESRSKKSVHSIRKRQLDGAIDSLGMPSSATLELLAVQGRPDTPSMEIAEIVERDVGLTIRLLQVANSPILAPVAPIESVAHAVSFLGERRVVAVAVAAGNDWMLNGLQGYGAKTGLFDAGLRTAIAAERIALANDFGDRVSTVYTAALLHDLGKVVLADFLSQEDRSSRILDQISKGAATNWLEAERSVLGFDHCEVGLMMAEKFGLGPGIREVISNHHDPSGASSEYRDLVEVVHAADLVRSISGGDASVDLYCYRSPESVRYLEHLDDSVFNQIVCDIAWEAPIMVAAVSDA